MPHPCAAIAVPLASGAVLHHNMLINNHLHIQLLPWPSSHTYPFPFPPQRAPTAHFFKPAKAC